MIRSIPTAMLLLAATPLSAQNSYEGGFDYLTGSAAGIPVAGRDGFQVPTTVPPSIDGAIYTYAGNTLGMPVLAAGATNFLGLDGSSAPAQVERVSNIPFDCHTHIEFDICVHSVAAGTPSGIIGGFSLQPVGSAATAYLVARWPSVVTSPPSVWNADIVVGPGATGVPIQIPDVRFQGLQVDRWYRWGCSVHLAHGEYTLFVIDDLASSRILFVPPAGTMLANPLGAAPTSFRLSAVGPGCRVAFDRMSVAYHATYEPYGAGCSGALGVPLLTDRNGSRPVLTTTFEAVLSGLPFNVGGIAWGFSGTNWGSVPLPLDLGPIQMPGCWLHVDPARFDFVAGTGGAAIWSLAIPGDSVFMGLQFFSQGASFDPAANPAGIAASNAARACLGR